MTQPCQNPELIPAFHSAGATPTSAFAVFNTAVEMLSDLPEDRETLVGFLTDIGIRGVPSSGEHCVLAQYVRSVTWPDDDIDVLVSGGTFYVGVGVDMEFLWGMPAHLVQFVDAYDRGEYPELSISDSGVEE